MIFLKRPITVQHIGEMCGRFSEGLRVEYKSSLDGKVRENLPKIVSSFANSQGGVLIVGIRTDKGVPQAPFEGFTPPPREELPLTVENICLQNINPPVLPRIEVVHSDVANRVFLVIEVDESGEAPHAIENSKRVYIRTGNASELIDDADVELIIDLMKRRQEPLERRHRLLQFAEQRSHQAVHRDRSFLQISICPTFPRAALCSSQEVWDFLLANQTPNANLLPFNSLRRIPDGTASQRIETQRPIEPAQHVEVVKYGLLFVARQFAIINWSGEDDQRKQLYFAGLFQALLRLVVLAERLYVASRYHGSVQVNISLHHVLGQAMRFIGVDPMSYDDPEDFRCYTDLVSVERRFTVGEIQARRLDVLTEILAELTWAFWQSNQGHPTERLKVNVQKMMQQMGV